jgi:hypothetical protein
MHFRAPHRNLAITLLLSSVTGCNDEHPDTTTDTDATAGTAVTATASGTATAGGHGSQAEESDDTDGRPNDR